MMRRVMLLALLVLVTYPLLAAPLAAPDVRKGQFVYVLPEGFAPPLIERPGVNAIQEAAARLHYPFYVVIVRDLPTARGSATDVDARRAIEQLVDDWSRDPDFHRATSMVF